MPGKINSAAFAWIKRNKKVTGPRAIEFIQHARHRPDLSTIVFPATCYELEDGRIVEAFVQTMEPEGGGLWDDEFPAVTIHLVYASEAELEERRESAMKRLEENGWVRPPERGPEKLNTLLFAEEAEAFFDTHQQLDASLYQPFDSSWPTGYFMNKAGVVFQVFRSPEVRPTTENPKGFEADYCVRIATKFDSQEHALHWAAYVEGSQPRHPLWKYTRNRADWKNDMPQWLDFFTENLGVECDALDFSVQSCKLLDKCRKRMKVSHATFLKSYFAPMLGYVCETVSRIAKGTWEMRPAFGNVDVWEPWIICEDGASFQCFTWFWDFSYEEYPTFSLAGTVQIATAGKNF